MQSVLIGIVSHSGKLAMECVGSLWEMRRHLCEKGVNHDLVILSGNPYVSWARNEVVSYFLTTEFENLFFIDDDVGFDPEAIFRLLERPEKVVAGAYPKKAFKGEWVVEPVLDSDGQEVPWGKPMPQGRPVYENGLMLAKHVGMGFAKIHRSAFKAITEANVSLVYQDQGKTCTDWFPIGVHDHVWYGEDNGFCNLWRETGGKVYIDPDINFTHTGNWAWQGNYAEYLTKLEGEQDGRVEQTQAVANMDV